MEEDEWDLEAFDGEGKEDEASKSRDLRLFDFSEDEKSEKNFKKKKE